MTTWIQDPLPGMTRAELGGEPVIHLFVAGQWFAACCGLAFADFTADDQTTYNDTMFNCWDRV